MNPQAKAYLESLGFGLAGAVVAAALQSVQAQGFGHLDWAVVGAAALTGALVYLQVALRWLGEPPGPIPQPPAVLVTTTGAPVMPVVATTLNSPGTVTGTVGNVRAASDPPPDPQPPDPPAPPA